MWIHHGYFLRLSIVLHLSFLSSAGTSLWFTVIYSSLLVCTDNWQKGCALQHRGFCSNDSFLSFLSFLHKISAVFLLKLAEDHLSNQRHYLTWAFFPYQHDSIYPKPLPSWCGNCSHPCLSLSHCLKECRPFLA